MTPPERHVRILATLLIVAGLGAVGLAILADALGVGSAPGTFGWKRATLLALGVAVTALGALLLAHPRRASDVSVRAAARRWLVLAALVSLVGLLAVFSIPRLADRLIGTNGGNDTPVPEAAPAPPPGPSPEDMFRAIAAEVCERHLAHLHEIAKRGYASAPAERPRLLRANATAVSALWADLHRLSPPPGLAASYSRLLQSLKRVAAALRGASAAVDEGKRGAEKRHARDVLAAASEANDIAAGIALHACQ